MSNKQLAEQFAKTNEAFHRLGGKKANLENQYQYFDAMTEAEAKPLIAKIEAEMSKLEDQLGNIDTNAHEAGGKTLAEYLHEKGRWDVY